MRPPPHRPHPTWDKGGVGVDASMCPTDMTLALGGARPPPRPHATLAPRGMRARWGHGGGCIHVPHPHDTGSAWGASTPTPPPRPHPTSLDLIIIDPAFPLLALAIGHVHAHHAPLISPLAPLPSLDHPHVPCPCRPPYPPPPPPPHPCPRPLFPPPPPPFPPHLPPCPHPLDYPHSSPSPTIIPSPGEDDVGGNGDDGDDRAGMTSPAWWCVWNAWGWVLREDEVGPAIS